MLYYCQIQQKRFVIMDTNFCYTFKRFCLLASTMLIALSAFTVAASPKVKELTISAGSNLSFAFSPDSKFLAYGTHNKIIILDIAKNKVKLTINENLKAGSPNSILWIKDKIAAIFGSSFGIWNAKTGKMVFQKKLKYEHGGFKLAYNPKADIVYAGNPIIGYSMSNGKTMMKTKKFNPRVVDMTISSNGEKLYILQQWGNKFSIISTKTGKLLKEVQILPTPSNMVLTHNDKFLFIKQMGQKLKQITVNGKLVTELNVKSFLVPLRISPDGKKLIIVTRGGLSLPEKLYVYDIGSKKMIKTIDIMQKNSIRAEVSPDSKIIALAANPNKGVIRIFPLD